jgi:IS30 family transposase
MVRRPRAARAANGQGQLRNAVNISARPAEAADRAVPGHWEGDLLLGSDNSAIATLVERSSRIAVLVRLPNGRSSEPVLTALAERIVTLPEQLVRSLTWDQGKEMALHAQFTIDTGLQIYICDPRSPWQRGTNENTNGLLRQYFPLTPTSPRSPRKSSTPSPRSSTAALDKPSAGGHPLRSSPRLLR